MLKQEDMTSTLCLNNSTTRARVCDACRSSPSTIYCEADSAFLCTACDSQLHAANKLSSHHKRVWVCQACEQAPAAFLCKADAASLCTTCDAIIHSANPLSRRHHRVPVMPVSGSNHGQRATEPWSVIGPGVDQSRGGFLSQDSSDAFNNEDEDEAASWLLFDEPIKNGQTENGDTNEFLINGDEYLDLVEYMNSGTNCDSSTNCDKIQKQRYGGCDADSLVPNQYRDVKKNNHYEFKNQKFELGMEFETSNGGYGYPASLGHSVSISSLDVGVVPESTTTEVSISNARTPKGTIDLFSSHSIEMPRQLNPTDRKARVLRYMEKKKTRKFEKTIRYASRKAYAETRPRVKGRFAKRTNVDDDMNQMFSTTLLTEGGYCIVPSF